MTWMSRVTSDIIITWSVQLNLHQIYKYLLTFSMQNNGRIRYAVTHVESETAIWCHDYALFQQLTLFNYVKMRANTRFLWCLFTFCPRPSLLQIRVPRVRGVQTGYIFTEFYFPINRIMKALLQKTQNYLDQLQKKHFNWVLVLQYHKLKLLILVLNNVDKKPQGQ